MINHIPTDQPFLQEYKEVIDGTEKNLYCENPNIEQLMQDFIIVLEAYKREIFIRKTLERNFINFSEIYIKNDEDRKRYIKDVLINNSRNYNDFCETYGGTAKDEDKPLYLCKNDDGEYYDIHNF